MAFSFGKHFSHGLQLLRFSPSWRCSAISIPIPSATCTSQRTPRLAEAHPLPNKTQLYCLAIRSLHTNPNTQDVQPKTDENPPKRKRKDKNPLRRVAVEAQRSQEITLFEKSITAVNQPTTKTVIAFCATEEYDIAHVSRILAPLGYQQDPCGTDLYPQVVHIETPTKSPLSAKPDSSEPKGDIFVFPSGAVVGWGVPHSTLSTLVTETLLPAAQQPHFDKLEEEDLEFLEDPTKEYSSIRGETIILGTKSRALQTDPEPPELSRDGKIAPHGSEGGPDTQQTNRRETVLAKIAFSSGLAKSTKIAVLESQLNHYIQTNKSMVENLARRKRLRMSRMTVLSKTGQLLGIRGQLNLYSELTDSLPDLFWDSQSELGLEGYYDQVGRTLDTNIRVKQLNERISYAQDVVNVLREATGEQKGLRVEWIIIMLISMELMFSTLNEYRSSRKGEFPWGMEGEVS